MRHKSDDLTGGSGALPTTAARALQLFAHDVRSSMTVVTGIVETVRLHGDRLDDDERAKLLERAEVHLAEINDMLGDITERAAIQSGHESVLLDVGASVMQQIEGLDVGTRRLELDLAHDVGLGRVGSPDVPRIVDQLLGNAVNHTRLDATIWVEVSTDGEYLQVLVSDDGRGVPAALRERVFEAAERGSAPPSVSGLGLGLYLAREIAHDAGGTLVCEERPGGGARFRLRLPFRPVHDDRSAASTAA